MKFVLTEEEMLRKYRSCVTPKERRDMIQVLADLNATDRKTVAEFLRENGEPVHGGARRKTPAIEAEPTTDPEPELLREHDQLPAPLRGHDLKPEREDRPAAGAPSPWMTLGTLRKLLWDLPGETEIMVDKGRMIRGMSLAATFGPDGERSSCTVFLDTGARDG
jgi:hypothetical protein